MADTFTSILKLVLPQLGRKPWKKDWDKNFKTLDQYVGGGLYIANDDTVHAFVADTVLGSAISSFVVTLTGSLDPASIPTGETHEIRVDTGTTLDFPLPPIFDLSSLPDVNAIILADRLDLTDAEEGRFFAVRIENHSAGTVAGSALSWRRKGLVLT